MKVEIELVGGLGNQLFGYYAGLYYSSKYNADLSLDFSNLESPIHMNSDLREFHLAPHQAKLRVLNKTVAGDFIRKVNDKVIISYPTITKIIHPLTEFFKDSNEFEVNPSGKKHRIQLRGYFGNFEYFESVKNQYPKPSLRTISDSFIRLSKEAETSRPIMLHIRRGDYVTHSKIYGLLSQDYYLEAIELASHYTSQDDIWVFSDDSRAAKTILKGHKSRVRLIEEEFKLTPAESMILQSLGIINITANSTFSAWAAALNDNAIQRICPDTYFLDNRETPNWPPKDWMAIRSKWE
jgi:hypothetical protein